MATNDEGLLWLLKEKYSFRKSASPENYDSYLKSILICANGDGRLAPEERDWVVGFASAFSASDSLVEELKSYKADEDIEKVISNAPVANALRRYLVYDTIMACSADAEYSDQERATISKMAAKLGISQDIVEQIEKICIEEIKLREKRVKLMYPEGAPM
jgi:uncharacterized membrane protein YebE (DUF533 family)